MYLKVQQESRRLSKRLGEGRSGSGGGGDFPSVHDPSATAILPLRRRVCFGFGTTSRHFRRHQTPAFTSESGPSSASARSLMAIQASFPFFISNSGRLEEMMEGGGGGLPVDLCHSLPQQQMAVMLWPLPPSDPPASVEDPSSALMLNLLERQWVETDEFLRQQIDQLVTVLQHQTKQQAAAILQSVECKVSFLLRQQEEELTKARRRTLELELYVKDAEEDRAKWQQMAAENEALAISLNNALEQVQVSRFSSTSGRPAKSSALRRCRACGHGDACWVLLPCCHLCCCGSCAAILEECPLCSSVKRDSVEVFLG
ncbi:E3 ubiquitin-protein ligase [Canna indica]|uniref:E3 ubiquitin-protein ligase n=1 Tax=Canna indica TaxID=4628 RepID=A0AAQ3KBW9_9LILI|nr:E3 ubiquitin-protein ligase [Canna indica]